MRGEELGVSERVRLDVRLVGVVGSLVGRDYAEG